MNTLTESRLDPATAVYRHVVLAGDHWSHEIKCGQVLRIVDLEGNQAAAVSIHDPDVLVTAVRIES